MEYIEELQDFEGTLGQLNKIVQRLILKHGKQTKIHTDAGHNNVDFVIGTRV